MIDGPRFPASISNVASIEALERTPIHARPVPTSVYDALRRGCSVDPGKTAICYFLRGDTFRPERIPLSAKLGHLAMRALKGTNIAHPYREVPYRTVLARVTQCANLLSELGVTKDDVVSTLLPNLVETVYVMLGAQTVGVINPINPLLEPASIKAILNAAKAKVLVGLGPAPGSTIWQKVQAVMPDVPTLRHVILIHGATNSARRILGFEDMIDQFAHERLLSERDVRLEDVASLFHTGGTTGTPRLVVGTHANTLLTCLLLELLLPLSHDDVSLLGLPLFHVNAASNMVFALYKGMKLIVAGPSGYRTPKVLKNFFEILEAHRVSIFSATPTVYSALLDQPPSGRDLSSVRLAISGAAPLPPAVCRDFVARTGIPVIEGYGQTEATVGSTLNPIAGEKRLGSVGIRFPYTDVRTVTLDSQGRWLRDCNVDEIGTILVRGPQVTRGYLDPSQNEKLWVTDPDMRRWLNTGDLGRLDRDGYLWLTGRSKEVIIRGGHNIDPRAIEEPLLAHPAVKDAAAVPRPDAHAGEVPVAYVTLRPGHSASQDDLLSHVRSQVQERAAIPKAIFVIDAMPLTALGKIFKPELENREIARVLQMEVRGLRENVKEVNVCVEIDPTLGRRARISVALTGATSRDQVSQVIAEKLSRYAVPYVLEMA